MNLEASGKIHVIKDAEQITEKFRKREFVLELDGNPQYPQHVLFQMTGDRCEQLDGYSVGDKVDVEFSLRGREWTSPKDGTVKYFNSLDTWAVRGEKSAPAPAPTPPPADADDDDVPF